MDFRFFIPQLLEIRILLLGVLNIYWHLENYF